MIMMKKSEILKLMNDIVERMPLSISTATKTMGPV